MHPAMHRKGKKTFVMVKKEILSRIFPLCAHWHEVFDIISEKHKLARNDNSCSHCLPEIISVGAYPT